MDVPWMSIGQVGHPKRTEESDGKLGHEWNIMMLC